MEAEIEIRVGQQKAYFIMLAPVDSFVKLAKMLALVREAASIADDRTFGYEKACLDGIALNILKFAVINCQHTRIVIFRHYGYLHAAYRQVCRGRTGSQRILSTPIASGVDCHEERKKGENFDVIQRIHVVTTLWLSANSAVAAMGLQSQEWCCASNNYLYIYINISSIRLKLAYH